MSQHATNTNADRPKPACHHCKQPGHHRNQCCLLQKQREQAEKTQSNPRKKFGANNSNPNNNTINKNNNNNNHKISKRTERQPKTVYPYCETHGKTERLTRKCYYGTEATNRPPPRHRRPEGQKQVPQRENQTDSNRIAQAATNATFSLRSCD